MGEVFDWIDHLSIIDAAMNQALNEDRERSLDEYFAVFANLSWHNLVLHWNACMSKFGMDVDVAHMYGQFVVFKKRLHAIFSSGQLLQCFTANKLEITAKKNCGFWTMHNEVCRMFLEEEQLYAGINGFLRIYSRSEVLGASEVRVQDSTEISTLSQHFRTGA